MGEGNGERGKRVPEVREEREEEDLAWKERLEKGGRFATWRDCDCPLSST